MRAACGVTAALAVLTLGMTWPLGARLTSSVPGGYGDPLLAIWSMGWVMRTLTAALAHPATLAGFWNANRFFPEPQALAFSEPFIGQSLLGLPVYWLSGNPILGYNVVFLAAWVLSGLGMFLLVRSLVAPDVTNLSANRAATVAGVAAALAIAFNPLRLGSNVSRLDVQSIHWLPFALYGVHRYLAIDSRRALFFAAIAAIALNLSSIDRMVYSSAAIVLFTVVEIVRLKRWQGRVWLELWAAAAGTLVATMVCTLPYLEMQRRLGGAVRPAGLELVIAMLLALGVGLVSASLVSRWPRYGAAGIAVALAAYLGWMRTAAFPLDQPLAPETLAAPPATLAVAAEPSPIYRGVRALSSDAVVLELPLGDPAYDLRYLFFAATHGRRLINGYAHVIPPGYRALQQVLVNPVLDPDETRKIVAVATHVIVHRAAWSESVATAVARQLTAMGGTVLAQDGDAVLFQMQPTERVTWRLENDRPSPTRR